MGFRVHSLIDGCSFEAPTVRFRRFEELLVTV
jgi:hypothetical protein